MLRTSRQRRPRSPSATDHTTDAPSAPWPRPPNRSRSATLASAARGAGPVPARPVRGPAEHQGLLPALGDGRELARHGWGRSAVDANIALAVVELDRAPLAD